MITRLFAIILMCSSIYCSNTNRKLDSQDSNKAMDDTTFKHHFNILDSAAKANPNKDIYACCTPSIKFMEVHTGIGARSDGTLLGKLTFSKEDLRKWHEWYDKNYKKEK